MKSFLYIFAITLFCLSSARLQAQIFDDFSDGDFTQNPTWVGDTANFRVNAAGQLQLSTTGAGQSAIWVQGNMPDSTIWEFDVRLNFSPSNQNLVRIYLQADQTDPALANGYYLEMGETGSADPIRLFRQNGASKTLLAAGEPGLAAVSPNLHIRVKRTSSFEWTLDAGTLGMALNPQFTVQDDTWPGGTALFFGFQCVYTTTNSSNFFFDNINIRPDVPDTQPPVLLSAAADNDLRVNVFFDEALDTVSAELSANYFLSNGIGQPMKATLAPNQRSVVLDLQNALSTGTYSLQSNGVADVFGNISGAQSVSFQYIKIDPVEEFDILITEIMADPNPSAGLPEVEWFELHNRSSKIIDLATLRFTDATSAPISIPSHLLNPGQYVALTAFANTSVLQTATIGPVIGVAMSASLLNNDGDVLTLSDLSGNVIDRVSYSVDWHTDNGRKDGGYTLERKNLGLPCLGGENWQSCPAQIGGTPAAQNASFSNDPDLAQPQLLKAFPKSTSTVLLTFSEGMDRSAAEDAAAYQLTPSIAVATASLDANDRALVLLELASPLQASTVYTLTIDNSVEDCSGNPYQMTETVLIGLPEKPAPHDFVINEILFNPPTGGARFIEFYNRSQKVFDWSQFFMASNTDSSSSVVKINEERLFFPGEYHVFSPNKGHIEARFANINPKNVIQNSLPSLDDKVDSIKIYWAGAGQTVTVDSFLYRREMHNALLSTSEQKGVSLERIRADGPTQSAANWTSASPSVTGAPGTPTLTNSQGPASTDPDDGLVSIPVARISPDGDNRDDFLEIFYNLPQAGYVATLSIFDSDGNLVKSLVRQQLVGTNGVLRWDGDANDGKKARPGIHVVYLEMFSPEGEVRRVKKPIAVVGGF